MPQPKYLVVIAGPTAVGKTSLAIELAEHYRSVILSADSRQFYRELNIGTAKPTEEQLRKVPHYFINTKQVRELYGAGHFERDARQQLEELFKEHNLVFMVGGSGLYLDAVLKGVDEFVEVPAHIRSELNQAFGLKGLTWLQEQVQKIDPVYFNSVDIHNPQRLIRALEVYTHTGSPYSSFLNKQKAGRHFIAIPLLINLQRDALYARINRRVDEMMQSGLLQEVRELEGLKELNALKTVGYKELYEHLEGKVSLEEAVEKIKQHTRNYAKRQLTWFKNRGSFEEFAPDDVAGIKNYIEQVRMNG